VVVLGMGFVGIVMAAVVADAVDSGGRTAKYVIGVQRPSRRSYWKVPLLNRGESPLRADDPEVAELIRRAVRERHSLTATFAEEAIGLADVVVVDVQCDYVKKQLGSVASGTLDMEALEQTFEAIGRHARPEALILIETTVAPGTTEQIAFPTIKRAYERRGITADPLLAHSYERVMPGRQYVASIRDFWRVCSGVNPAARERVVKFLSEVINVKKFPLSVLDRPIESETAKIVENSYRATILAFMDEWTVFAERNGVDIKKVIDAVRVRPTHSNLMFPGPGIGGYCLPKDGALGAWGYEHILGWEDGILRLTPQAIDINDTRALRVPQLVRDALRNMGEPIAAADVLILGVSYREDVGDTRYSGSEIIVRRLVEMGARVKAHDPYVEHWAEIEDPEVDESGTNYRIAAFSRQSQLDGFRMEPDMWSAMKGARALVLAVRHAAYLGLDPERVLAAVGRPFALVDCFCILTDPEIRRYVELGCEVKGMGRGHVKSIKESVRKAGE
jgi:UDP-N-acetyl-D-glucosamine dehydrogenase